MLGRIDYRIRSAHADSHQVDFFHLVRFTDVVDNVVHIAVNVVIDGQETVLARRVAPVDHVQVDSVLKKILDNAAAGLQVEHGFAIDQRVDHQKRMPVLALGDRRVVLELDAVLLVNDLVRGGGDVGLEFLKQYIRRLLGAALRFSGIFGQLGQNEINGNFGCIHQGLPFCSRSFSSLRIFFFS